MFKIYDGRESFYQWDANRKLIVEDPSIIEVHFCNRTDECSLVCETFVEDGLTLVNVPNILLQTDWKIHVYAYDGSYTKHEECYEVISRTKPADYVYEDTLVKTIVGKNTEGNGEIFNDYTNNQAISENSHAEGTKTLAGCRAFGIVEIDAANRAFILDSVEGLAIGDTYSCQMDYCFDLYGKINAIIEDKNRIVVDKFPTQNVKLEETSYFFIPAKPFIGTQTIGEAAHAEGLENKAIEKGSHAEGWNNVSAGKYSHTEGLDNIAGYGAHAEGFNNQSLGEVSHTEGRNNVASGSTSHAEGGGTVASGNRAHSEGSDTKATGSYSHAEGKDSNASGQSAHTEGYLTTATSHAAHAEGSQSHALAEAAHAEGMRCHVNAKYGHAEGYNTTVGGGGEAAHAEGDGTTANYKAAHAEGIGTQANSSATHVEGNYTYAQGFAAHAEGSNTTANGSYSHAEGQGCVLPTDATAAHVQGRFNAYQWGNKFAHIVGNGTSTTDRRNAHTLDWDGNAWYAGGILLTTPDGSKKYRITIDNNGNLKTELFTKY